MQSVAHARPRQQIRQEHLTTSGAPYAAILDTQRSVLEGVATTKGNPPVRVSNKAGGPGFTHAFLDDLFFCDVHRFDTDIEVICDIIVDAGVKLATVQRVDREAKGRAT